jgi:hypothetical protein
METIASTKITDQIRAAIRSEPQFGRMRDHVEIVFKNGMATLEGDAANVAVKKLAMERTAALARVVGIVDRLSVKPAQRMRAHPDEEFNNIVAVVPD